VSPFQGLDFNALCTQCGALGYRISPLRGFVLFSKNLCRNQWRTQAQRAMSAECEKTLGEKSSILYAKAFAPQKTRRIASGTLALQSIKIFY
jgi:hypothetical protein